MQNKLEVEPITSRLLVEEKEAFQAYQKAIRDEEITCHLKSQSLWLTDGDQNTSFFHKQARARVLRNNVKEIKTVNGETLHSFEDFKGAAVNYFERLYTEGDVVEPAELAEMLENIPNSITHANNENLTQIIKEEEVQGAIWGLDPDKAPRPNGFTIHFYRSC